MKTIDLSTQGKKNTGYSVDVDNIDFDLKSVRWSYSYTNKKHEVRKEYALTKAKPSNAELLGVPVGTWTYLHRVILARKLQKNYFDIQDVDHRNGDGLDCTRNNLREATRSENTCNKTSVNKVTGFKGVHKSGKKFIAELMKDGIKYRSGPFKTIEEAKQARLDLGEIHHGEFNRC